MNDLPELPDFGNGTNDILKGLEKVEADIAAKQAPAKKKAATKEDNKPEEPEKPKFSKEELLAVFDKLVFEGRYEETYKGRGITVGFRSRTGDDSVSISRALDNFESKTGVSIQTYVNMLTLSHSLVFYNGKTFEDKAVKEKFAYLSSLPDAVLTILMSKLNEFDEKVWLSMDEGRKNF